MDQNMDKLKKATKDNTPLLYFNGLITYAKAVEIHTGDSFDIIILYSNVVYRFKAKMFGYDCIEVDPSHLSLKNGKEIEKKIIDSKNRLIELIGDKEYFKIHCHEIDKYGRLLISVMVNNDSNKCDFKNTVNNIMIQEGHGSPYWWWI
jgi:hypothetical protein